MTGPSATPSLDTAKQAAIEQWTADPCGANVAGGEPGSREYFERLLRARVEYAPWMPKELGYDETRGLRILDVGCGQGIDVANFALAGAQVTGIDVTPRHIELARLHVRALGLEADLVLGDAEALPFDENSFDWVSSNGVLHHTPNMDGALCEIYRVLRPGGEARIVVYNRNSFHYWLTQVLVEGVARGGLVSERSMAGVLSRGVEYSRIGARPLVRVYSRRQLVQLLTSAGFRDVRAHPRHFQLSDTPLTHPLRRFPVVNRPELLERLGRIGGWYVVARGVKAADDGLG